MATSNGDAAFKLIHGDEEGIHHAIAGHMQISVLPDAAQPRKTVFYRNTMTALAAPQRKGRFLVVHAGDVFLYIDGSHIIITKNPDCKPPPR